MKKHSNKRIIKINNKGFSMIEILAVIVILGVVSTIGVVSVTSLISKSRQHYYKTQEEQMVLAAQAYAADNTNILPKTIGGMSTVTLKELMEKKYIKEEIVDQNKEKCYLEARVVNGKNVQGSRVDIYKSSKKDYTYTGHLECRACAKDKKKTNGDDYYACADVKDETYPYATIGFPESTSANQNNDLYNDSSVIKITMKGSESDETILVASYSYKIYVNGIVKYSSGLKINNKKYQVIVNEKLNKYLPGKVKVTVAVTNNKGNTITKTVTKNYSDATPPACGQVTYEGANKMKSYNSRDIDITTLKCGSTDYPWVGLGHNPNTRRAWVVCNDEYGIGCKQHEYSKYMTTQGEHEVISLSDEGDNAITDNNKKCKIKKCIDKTTPKIVVNVYKATSSGGKSGNAVYTYTKEGSTTTVNYTTSDKNTTWLNKANYANGVYIEVEASDPLARLKSFSWYQNPKNKRENAEGNATEKVDTKTWTWSTTDNNNKKTYSTHIYIKDDGVRKEVITVEDFAGNKTTYTLILKIDRTAPTKPPTIALKKWNNNTRPTSTSGLSNYSNNTWLSGKVFTQPSGSADSPNVSGFKEYQYTTTGKTSNESNHAATYRNIEAEGISYITWRACDYAGNCSAYTDKNTIKLDRKDPVCTVSNSGGTSGSNHWYVGGTVTATGKCTDPAASGAGDSSGCREADKTVTVQTVNSNSPSSSGTTATKKVYDVAGNSTTCSSTIKYDKSNPYCQFWVDGGGAYFTSYGDNGPSGVASKSISPGTGLRATTYTGSIRDNAGNSRSCSTGSITVINANPYYARTKHHCNKELDHITYTCSSGTLQGTTCKVRTGQYYDNYCYCNNQGAPYSYSCNSFDSPGGCCNAYECAYNYSIVPTYKNVAATPHYHYNYYFSESTTNRLTSCSGTGSFGCNDGNAGSNYYTCGYDGTYYCNSGTLIGGAYCRL